MKADTRFINQPKEFWANVRTISQEVGYTERGRKSIKIPSIHAICEAFTRLNLTTAHIVDNTGCPTNFGRYLLDYFAFRAHMLNDVVQHQFMSKEIAEQEFFRLKSTLSPQCPLPMNKQTAEKKNYAFLTGIVNMLIEEYIGKTPCDYDPRSLTTITWNAMPLRTLSRRVDGAFPSVIDPIAIWEIKEYYYTKTFGSRVADGIYET